MLEELKILTNGTDEALLNLLLERSKKEVVSYCRLTEYTEALNDIVVDIAAIKYNRVGTEGLQSQGYSGASETYLDDYPMTIQKRLNVFRKKVKFL